MELSHAATRSPVSVLSRTRSVRLSGRRFLDGRPAEAGELDGPERRHATNGRVFIVLCRAESRFESVVSDSVLIRNTPPSR